jgi:hypothetical protein
MDPTATHGAGMTFELEGALIFPSILGRSFLPSLFFAILYLTVRHLHSPIVYDSQRDDQLAGVFSWSFNGGSMGAPPSPFPSDRVFRLFMRHLAVPYHLV